MSRIGMKPVPIPPGVEVSSTGKNHVKVKGPKGTLEDDFHPDMKIVVDEAWVRVERPTNRRDHRSLHGLTRSLIANMVHGVTEGYQKALEIHGVGYQAQLKDPGTLTLQIGFCHPVEVAVPTGLQLEVEGRQPVRIKIQGMDKQQVGQFAAQVRAIRPPEPYNAKGIRYQGEQIRRKQGKAFGAARE